jgi:exodeoxyribonuclease VII large subunit
MAAGRLAQALSVNTHTHGVRFARAGARLTPAALGQRLRRERTRISDLALRASRAMPLRIREQHRRLDALAKLLESLGYDNVLKRGFALIRDEAGNVLRSAAAVSPGAELDIEFADGRVGATAHGAPGLGGKRRRTSPASAKPGRQGSLF